MSALERLVEATVEYVSARLPEGASVLTATSLPRGADPLAGGERPMLCAGMRWTALPPGGVVIAGGPSAMAAFLGCELPAKPEAPAPEAAAAADASDEDGEPGADSEAAEPPAQAPEAEAADGDEAEGEAGAGAEAAPAPELGPSWSSQVADAARPAATSWLTDLAHHLAGLAALPLDCTPARIALTEQPRAEVGPVPDGLVVVIDLGGQEVRLVVIASGVLLARMDAAVPAPAAEDGDASSADGADRDPSGMTRTLTEVPLDIALRVGRVHTPLAAVTALRDGDLLELDAAPDDPVQLVAGTTPVASGTLEVAADGTLQMLVTRVDNVGQGGLPPRTPHADVMPGGGPGGGPALVALDGAGAEHSAPDPEATASPVESADGAGDGAGDSPAA